MPRLAAACADWWKLVPVGETAAISSGFMPEGLRDLTNALRHWRASAPRQKARPVEKTKAEQRRADDVLLASFEGPEKRFSREVSRDAPRPHCAGASRPRESTNLAIRVKRALRCFVARQRRKEKKRKWLRQMYLEGMARDADQLQALILQKAAASGVVERRLARRSSGSPHSPERRSRTATQLRRRL